MFPETPENLANALKAPLQSTGLAPMKLAVTFSAGPPRMPVDLAIAVGGVALAYIVALPFGLCAGYFGGKVIAYSVVSESILTFPSMVLAILLLHLLGQAWIGLILTIMVTQAPQLIRYIRGFVMQIRNMEYIEAAKASGSKTFLFCLNMCCGIPQAIPRLSLSLLASEAVLVASALGF